MNAHQRILLLTVGLLHFFVAIPAQQDADLCSMRKAILDSLGSIHGTLSSNNFRTTHPAQRASRLNQEYERFNHRVVDAAFALNRELNSPDISESKKHFLEHQKTVLGRLFYRIRNIVQEVLHNSKPTLDGNYIVGLCAEIERSRRLP